MGGEGVGREWEGDLGCVRGECGGWARVGWGEGWAGSGKAG